MYLDGQPPRFPNHHCPDSRSLIESNSSHDDYAEIVDEEADYSSPSRDFELDRDCVDLREILGMISHKKLQITIFGHKNEIKKFYIFR